MERTREIDLRCTTMQVIVWTGKISIACKLHFAAYVSRSQSICNTRDVINQKRLYVVDQAYMAASGCGFMISSRPYNHIVMNVVRCAYISRERYMQARHAHLQGSLQVCAVHGDDSVSPGLWAAANLT